MSRKNGGIIGPANTPVGGLFKGVASGVWRMNDLLNFVSNSQWPTGPQNIDNSCLFDGTGYGQRSISTAGSGTTATFSVWAKTSALPDKVLWTSYIDANNYVEIYFNSGQFRVFHYDGGSTSNDVQTNAYFRDRSAWYHFHVIFDTTNGTEADRIQMYVNGTRLTDFKTANYPTSSQDLELSSSSATFNLGARNADEQWKGYMAEMVFIDNQALTPSSFGETDSTTGIWKPKKIGAFSSAGTNSFYLDFKDSSNLGKDASGLGNNFTVTNIASTDQMTDTCVENFATLNSLNNVGTGANPTYSEGNLKVVSSADNYFGGSGNIGVTTGKWYLEVELDAESTSGQGVIGMSTNIFEEARQNRHFGQLTSNPSVGYYGGNGNKVVDGATDSSYGDTYAAGDIIGIAIDLDNNKIYFSKNGTFQNSGVPTSGSTGTGAISLTATDREWFLSLGDAGSSTTATYLVNFGNPPFSISSGNSDANGHGNFEYSVPSGYYALNTSNLNTYG